MMQEGKHFEVEIIDQHGNHLLPEPIFYEGLKATRVTAKVTAGGNVEVRITTR